jgi:hypothetical protein
VRVSIGASSVGDAKGRAILHIFSLVPRAVFSSPSDDPGGVGILAVQGAAKSRIIVVVAVVVGTGTLVVVGSASVAFAPAAPELAKEPVGRNDEERESYCRGSATSGVRGER